MRKDLSHPFAAGILCVLCVVGGLAAPAADCVPCDPYNRQGQEKIEALQSSDPGVRSRAGQALGYMRYYPAEDALIEVLGSDSCADVRRNAALSIGWCGGRRSLMPLGSRLADEDWNVRQSAWVALTNITGMEHPLDALADRSERGQVARVWRQWCTDLPEHGLPDEVLDLIGSAVHREVQRGLRAAGALGVDGQTVGWTELYLVVDEVDDYYMDRANWADAKLVDADGRETFLDALEPVSAQQQHDSLRINQSASFDDLRIGQQRFEHGLHTHAFSVITTNSTAATSGSRPG